MATKGLALYIPLVGAAWDLGETKTELSSLYNAVIWKHWSQKVGFEVIVLFIFKRIYTDHFFLMRMRAYDNNNNKKKPTPLNIGSEDEWKWNFASETGFVEVSWLRTKRRQVDLWKPSQGHEFLPNPAGTTITFLHQRNQSYKILHLFSAYCWPEIIRLPDTSPGKMGLLAISRELQFRVCNLGKPWVSLHMSGEEEHFCRGDRAIVNRVHAFHWLSPWQERRIFFLLELAVIEEHKSAPPLVSWLFNRGFCCYYTQFCLFLKEYD